MEKQGALIVNRFLNTAKFRELTGFLVDAAARRGIALTLYDNAQLLFDAAHGRPLVTPRGDFGIFWDKDVRLGEQLEKNGMRLFNTARSIALCDDKSYTHMALAGKLRMPKTICGPMTFKGVGYNDLSFLDRVAEALRYPFVIKECCGSFGRQVYFIHSRADAEALLARMDGTPVLFQEFVRTSIGRDLRVNVVGGEVRAAMMRVNEQDFRANITNGGTAMPYTPTPAQADMALTACRILGVEFAGVDILFGREDEPILCEVNSNAHFKSIYECTGVNLADDLLAYIDREVYA